MGVEFAAPVLWRVSKRGLLIGGIEGDALLLEHARAAQLPDLLADAPSAAELAQRLGEPHGENLVAEMRALGILTQTATRSDTPRATPQDRDAPTCCAVQANHPAPSTSVGHEAAAGSATDPVADEGRAMSLGAAGSGRPAVVFTRSGAEFPGIERPARWLDRQLVPFLLSWPGRLLLALAVAGGLAAFILGRPAGPTVSSRPWLDALLGLLVVLAASAAHELAHAVALVHYGRRPRRAGFGFYWGGVSFYVDSSEALTLPRRQRVTQALVGLAVDIVTTCLLAITAHLAASVLIVAVAWRLAVTAASDLIVNALPILELDGHWALADHLDEPELAPRARAAFGDTLRRFTRRVRRQVVRRRSPSDPVPTKALPQHEPGLALFGAVSVLVGLVLLVGSALVWWVVAKDLITALFTGNPAEIIIGVALVGPVAVSLLASSAGLLLETAVAEPTSSL